jgi:internalin A
MTHDQAYLAAEKKIQQALHSGATELDLSNMKLTELPDSLGQLTQLQTLSVNLNLLTSLPESLGNLSNLKSLNIGSNKFTSLPVKIEKLTQLSVLKFYGNRLSEIPSWISHLKLKELIIGDSNGGIPFDELPSTIRELTVLETLWLGKCELRTLPEWIGELPALKSLWCFNNNLTDLPPSLAQLEHLKELKLSGNPLNPALQSAYDACSEGKYEPLFAYLHSLEQNAEPLYEAKLVLVGEGNVGKTTLLKALKGKAGAAPQEHEPTTHGVEIDIHGLRLPHPAQDGVEIQLNAWDFGGQDVYRVTHQFFFSRRSLYLLVWEPRRGVQQGQVEDWLNMIRLRVGDDARVIIVSTHCKTGERIARIDQPVFKQQYGDMIVGFHEVDSLVPDEATGEMVGIAELKKIIAEHASKLEQMGMGFNRDWKAARDEPRISFSTFSGVCAARGLSGIDTETLAHLMHDLGYIVHYSDDEKLRDDVILKPEWLTKAIGFVLEDRKTQELDGILPDNRLYQVWHDHPFKDEPQRYTPDLYPFFLRLMEKYDVSYRLPEGDASLVAQHVPQTRPPLPWQPEEEPKDNQRRLGMVCVMDEAPQGLVPWMIVRTHDYAYPVGQHSLHWQKGMFLRNNSHGEAMLELRGREFHMYAEAVWPEYFMNLLRQRLDKLITDNWPGLEGHYSFTVPCKNNACEGRFEIAALRTFLNEGDDTIRCQKCRERQNIIELLYGFEDYDIRENMTTLQRTVEHGFANVGDEFEKLRSQIANGFLNAMKAMANEAKNGPRLFTVEPVDGNWQWINKKYKLQLWCEAEDCQHPVYDGLGVYEFKMTSEWIAQIAPYANFIVGVMKTLLPMVAPSVNVLFGSGAFDQWKYKDHLNLIQTSLSSVLPEGIKVHDPGRLKDGVLTEPERSGLLALHSFLREVDPNQERIGLYRIPTYTGDFTWVCKKHYDLMQSKIPDVIHPHD